MTRVLLRSLPALCALALPAMLPAFDDAASEAHFYRAGLLATTSFYQDQILKKGFVNGNYRPFAIYSYADKWTATVRGNLALKYYGETPAGADRQTRLVGILEITSFAARLKRHAFTAGRSFYQTEQGILFANFADGLMYEGTFGFGHIKAMALYSADYGKGACAININGCGGDPNPFNTIPGLQPDASVTGSGQRLFATLEYSAPAFEPKKFRLAPHLYAVWSRDLIKESATVVTRYEYNPFYAGLGISGYAFIPKLRYRLDGIFQGGDAFNQTANGESLRTSITAVAALMRFSYDLPVAVSMLPQVNGEIVYASGDADAQRAGTASQSNTAGNYTAFQAFGAYSGGLALKPRLTNIHIYRAGFDLRPFRKWYWARAIAVSFKYSLYRKAVATGGISDSGASEPSADIGMAGDAGLSWLARSDLQFFYGFGLFKPGEAYPVLAADGGDGRALRQAHIVSLTLVF